MQERSSLTVISYFPRDPPSKRGGEKLKSDGDDGLFVPSAVHTGFFLFSFLFCFLFFAFVFFFSFFLVSCFLLSSLVFSFLIFFLLLFLVSLRSFFLPFFLFFLFVLFLFLFCSFSSYLLFIHLNRYWNFNTYFMFRCTWITSSKNRHRFFFSIFFFPFFDSSHFLFLLFSTLSSFPAHPLGSNLFLLSVLFSFSLCLSSFLFSLFFFLIFVVVKSYVRRMA